MIDLLPDDWDRTLPVVIQLCFRFLRPKTHYTSKGLLTKRAPKYYTLSKNDADKLSRAVLDSLTSIVYDDDGQVVRLIADRRYCEKWEAEGVDINISMLTDA